MKQYSLYRATNQIMNTEKYKIENGKLYEHTLNHNKHGGKYKWEEVEEILHPHIEWMESIILERNKLQNTIKKQQEKIEELEKSHVELLANISAKHTNTLLLEDKIKTLSAMIEYLNEDDDGEFTDGTVIFNLCAERDQFLNKCKELQKEVENLNYDNSELKKKLSYENINIITNNNK